jgi:hypothetical protein
VRNEEVMRTPVQAFEHAILVKRVATRFATEFPTENALKLYLKDHPDADKSKHSVAKGDGGSKSKGEKAKGPDATLANAEAAKSTSRSAETDKHLDEMKGLKKKVDDADHSAKKKFDRAYDKLLANGEAAEKAAEKLLKKYDNMSDGLEGDNKEESEAGLKMLEHWLGEWKSTAMDHHRAKGELAHKKLQQAEQTHGYAQTLEKWVRQVSKSLKGDHQDR